MQVANIHSREPLGVYASLTGPAKLVEPLTPIDPANIQMPCLIYFQLVRLYEWSTLESHLDARIFEGVHLKLA